MPDANFEWGENGGSSAKDVEIELESFVVEACEICRTIIESEDEAVEMHDPAKSGSAVLCHRECGESAGLEIVA